MRGARDFAWDFYVAETRESIMILFGTAQYTRPAPRVTLQPHGGFFNQQICTPKEFHYFVS